MGKVNRNKTTGITVYYELGGIPWLDLIRLKGRSPKIVEAEDYDLNYLIKEVCPHRALKLDYKFQEAANEDIERILSEYADILKAYGHDILTGNFSIFPKLKKHVNKDYRQANLEYYGSETGETPQDKQGKCKQRGGC